MGHPVALPHISCSIPQTPSAPHPPPHTPSLSAPPNKGQTPPQRGSAPQTRSSLCTAVYCGRGALLGWGRGAAARGGPDPTNARGSHPRLLRQQPGGHEARGEGAAVAGGPDVVPAWPSMARHTAHGARHMAHGRRSAGSGRGAAGGHRRSCGGRGGRGAGARCPVAANWCPAGRWASGARCRWDARAPRRSRRVAALGTRNGASAAGVVALGTAGRAWGGGGGTPRTPGATVLLLPRLLLVTLRSLGVLGDL